MRSVKQHLTSPEEARKLRKNWMLKALTRVGGAQPNACSSFDSFPNSVAVGSMPWLQSEAISFLASARSR